VIYLVVIGGTLAAGIVPALGYVAYKSRKSRRWAKEARKRRDDMIKL
jgi:hypothetical protein